MGAWLLRSVEFALGAAGVVFLGLYAGAALDGFANSQLAVEEFKSARPAPSASVKSAGSAADFIPAIEPRFVDFGLWSAKRIAAFENSLSAGQKPPVAVLRISKISLEIPVFGDASELSLNRGAGWISGTARPGENGNVGIAGHRDGFFRGLKDLSPGDEVLLLTQQQAESFRVDNIEIVSPEDTSVLRPAGRRVTLVTCYPFYYIGSAPRRFIVEARFEGEVPLAVFSEVEQKAQLESNAHNFQGGNQQ